MIRGIRKKWYVLLGLLFAAALLCLWLFLPGIGEEAYTLPVTPEEIESVTLYLSASDWGLKKEVTLAEDVALIVDKLNSMHSAATYHAPEWAPGAGRLDLVFHLNNGSTFICAIADEAQGYYSDGTTKLRSINLSGETLYDSMDYPEEVGFVHWDRIDTPEF